MQISKKLPAFWRGYRFLLTCFLLSSWLGLSSFAAPSLPPQGGGTIVMEDDLLRATSIYPEDPVVRIELWDGGSLVHVESACGSQSCSTSLSQLSAGGYIAVGFTQSGAQFSSEITLE